VADSLPFDDLDMLIFDSLRRRRFNVDIPFGHYLRLR
jgi:hypothetical protein